MRTAPVLAVCASLVATRALLACSLDTTGEGAPGGADSGSSPDARRDVAGPPLDALVPPDADAPVGDASAPDATEASSDVSSPSEAAESAPFEGGYGEGGYEAGTDQSVEVTFYGWDDNSPPGTAIAYPMYAGYPTVHDAAGGTGTYSDPITFASDKSEIPVGTLVYAPFIEKYLVMEDDCGQCDKDWSGAGKWHIDVWMNSDGSESPGQLAKCEGFWTRAKTTVEIGAPPGRTVTTDPLFVPSSNTCRSTP